MNSPNPRPAVSRRGGIVSGLLLTALAIAVLVAAVALYAVHNVKVDTLHSHNGDNVSIDTPAGHLQIQAHEKLNPESLGIPLYPGAKRAKDGGGATFSWTSSDGKDDKAVSVAGGDFLTPDPPGRVVEYYRSQLPNWMIVTDRDGATHLEFTRDGYKRIVAIREKGDGTHIGVASVGEPASN